MDLNPSRSSPFLMLIDKDAIKAAIERAANCKLPRRECRPLDQYKGKSLSADLARYDAEVEPDDLADEEPDFDLIDSIADTAGISDDNFGEDDY